MQIATINYNINLNKVNFNGTNNKKLSKTLIKTGNMKQNLYVKSLYTESVRFLKKEINTEFYIDAILNARQNILKSETYVTRAERDFLDDIMIKYDYLGNGINKLKQNDLVKYINRLIDTSF